MISASERTRPLQRPGASLVGPERLLRSAIRLESADREDVANLSDHDVAFEHATISMDASAVDVLPRLVGAHTTI